MKNMLIFLCVFIGINANVYGQKMGITNDEPLNLIDKLIKNDSMSDVIQLRISELKNDNFYDCKIYYMIRLDRKFYVKKYFINSDTANNEQPVGFSEFYDIRHKTGKRIVKNTKRMPIISLREGSDHNYKNGEKSWQLLGYIEEKRIYVKDYASIYKARSMRRSSKIYKLFNKI